MNLVAGLPGSECGVDSGEVGGRAAVAGAEADLALGKQRGRNSLARAKSGDMIKTIRSVAFATPSADSPHAHVFVSRSVEPLIAIPGCSRDKVIRTGDWKLYSRTKCGKRGTASGTGAADEEGNP